MVEVVKLSNRKIMVLMLMATLPLAFLEGHKGTLRRLGRREGRCGIEHGSG